MRKLELVGLETNGRHVVFADESGDEYAVPADDRLRAALRGDRARLGQLEIDMDSALRPRDIQARIRAGDSPEDVAVVAQVSVEKIMPYCVPVLAERRHITDLARRHHVRRKNAEGPARSLDSIVSERLRGREIEPAATEWDGWRRDDGRWAVRATYHSGESEHTADFVFDPVGRYSLADDDEARWLTGEQQSTRKGPQPREAGPSGERRLSAVRTADDLLSLSDPATGDDELTDDLTAVVRAVSEPDIENAGALDEPGPDSAAGSADPTTGEVAADDDGGSGTGSVESLDGPAGGDTATSGPAVRPGQAATGEPARVQESTVEPSSERRRRTVRRASVPSWDEIMLGGKTHDDEHR